MWFYWISVASKARGVLIGVTVVCTVALCVIFSSWCCYHVQYDAESDEGYYAEQKRTLKFLNKMAKIFAPLTVLLWLAVVFIPGRNTLIEMQIAKFATYENAEWTLDTIKSAVDYIVEAIGAIK